MMGGNVGQKLKEPMHIISHPESALQIMIMD